MSAVLITMLLAGSACTSAPSPQLGPPGSLVSLRQVSAPAGASAWDVRYVSTGLDGKAIEVAGVVIAPRVAGRERPVIAWAHPTSGIAQSCAPSQRGPGFDWIAGLHDMLARGYVVAATDYPGLGSGGIHPYLVGISEARAVLDSVRAARHIATAGAGSRFATWGHSQGGHAALWTGRLATAYAPDLELVGVAAAAPPTDLYDTVKYHVQNNGSRILAAYLLASWSSVYGAPLRAVLDARSIRALAYVAKYCIQTKPDVYLAILNNFYLGTRFLNARMHEDPTWNKLFAENAPGIARKSLPYFISQGTTDETVPLVHTTAYFQRLCRNGNRVEYLRLSGIGHTTSGFDSAGQAVAWMADRFANKAAPDQCNSKS